jgi:integrase
MARRKKWRYRAGEHGNSVTVYERDPGGPIWARTWDARTRGWKRRSLGHRDRDRAKSYADKQAAKLREGSADILHGRIALADVFAVYERYRTLRKKPESRKVDRRQMELWKRFIGRDKDPHAITLGEWQAFADARASGAIDARGNPVPPDRRRKLRTRPVEKDLAFLKHVLRWAARWRNADGHYLMRENPVRGFPIQREKNPRRPVASQDRLEAVRKVAAKQTTDLLEILDIVAGTGRRISAVLALRYDDLVLERSKAAPFGAIRWRADSDKMGYESTVPIGPDVREAVDRVISERPSIGAAPLFPSPSDLAAHVRKDVVGRWLRKAEEAAGLEPQKGGLWHPYRRKWATERKHLPTADVAAAGGWRSLEALQQCYQMADDETMLAVVLGGGELREMKG